MTQTQINLFRFLFALALTIEAAYRFGTIVGEFYWKHCHAATKEAFAFTVNRAILVAELFVQGCQVIYRDRAKLLAQANDIRNTIGAQFVYR